MKRLTAPVYFLFLFFSGACTTTDRSILTKEGDKFLDCKALTSELVFAQNLGKNAPVRRRHIRALQEEKQCLKKPKVSLSIGLSKVIELKILLMELSTFIL